MTKPSPLKWFKTSPEIICLVVILYFRLPPTLRSVEKPLLERCDIVLAHDDLSGGHRVFDIVEDRIVEHRGTDRQHGVPNPLFGRSGHAMFGGAVPRAGDRPRIGHHASGNQPQFLRCGRGPYRDIRLPCQQIQPGVGCQDLHHEIGEGAPEITHRCRQEGLGHRDEGRNAYQNARRVTTCRVPTFPATCSKVGWLKSPAIVGVVTSANHQYLAKDLDCSRVLF